MGEIMRYVTGYSSNSQKVSKGACYKRGCFQLGSKHVCDNPMFSSKALIGRHIQSRFISVKIFFTDLPLWNSRVYEMDPVRSDP